MAMSVGGAQEGETMFGEWKKEGGSVPKRALGFELDEKDGLIKANLPHYRAGNFFSDKHWRYIKEIRDNDRARENPLKYLIENLLRDFQRLCRFRRTPRA